MQDIEKWINEYIKNINLEKIEWIQLNSVELNEFIEKNYLDRKLWEYVHDKNENSIYKKLLGMCYLNFSSPKNAKKYNFLLGIVNNNIDKKTIVCSIIYLDEYFMFTNQKEPVTYISTIEVNSYFRNQGIYKRMCDILFDFINKNQHIIISKQSELGKKCKVYDILIETAIKKEFDKYIFEANDDLSNSEIYDILCLKQKTLRHKKT